MIARPAFVVTTLAAFLAALVVGREITDLPSLLFGVAVGVMLVVVGFAAATRCRPHRPRPVQEHVTLMLLSLACGVGVGILNLAANMMIAGLDPEVRTQLVERFRLITPVLAVVVAPVTEEVALRLFFMSGVAWLVSRVSSRPAVVFGVALVVSAVVFAVLHLNRPMPGNPSVATIYSIALVAKYSLAGLVQGVVFWRWGLPHAIVCHATVNATHLLLEPFVF